MNRGPQQLGFILDFAGWEHRVRGAQDKPMITEKVSSRLRPAGLLPWALSFLQASCKLLASKGHFRELGTQVVWGKAAPFPLVVRR